MKITHVQIGTQSGLAKAAHLAIFDKFSTAVALGMHAREHMGGNLNETVVMLLAPNIVRKWPRLSAAVSEAGEDESFICFPHDLRGCNDFMKAVYPSEVDDKAYTMLAAPPGPNSLWVLVCTDLGFSAFSVEGLARDEPAERPKPDRTLN